MEISPIIDPGVYRHYAGGLYQVLFMARHTETDTPLVIYLPLYAHSNGGLVPQARPARMWLEEVSPGVKRFTFVGHELPKNCKDEKPG